MQSDPYRQTKNLLICRSSLLDGRHLYSMGDLAKGWKERKKKSGWALLPARLPWKASESRAGGETCRDSWAAISRRQQLVSPPPAPALLTVLRTLTALCGVCHVLLADAVLVCLPVSARAGADPGLEAPTAQYLTAGRRWRHATGQKGHGGEKKRQVIMGGVMAYSLVSKVTMMRIGRLFIPPTQLELHIKLYKIVVNSVPTWATTQQWGWGTIRSQVKGRGWSLFKTASLMSLSGDKRRTRSLTARPKI